MKHKKKMGFTLIELLITITVLALITSIVYPIITSVMLDAKEKAYKIQIDNIVKASNDWVKRFPSALPDEDGDAISIQLLHLKKAGLVDTDLKNPVTKKLFPDDMIITITYTKNKYVPVVDDTSGTKNVDSAYKGMIVLKGEAHLVEEINSKPAFVDPGVIGYDENGKTIASSNIVTTVRKKGTVVSKVDMSTLGLYELTYETSIEGKKAQTKRTVLIVDTTPPILTIPKNTNISASSSSFDIMEGVSASDNSGESISVTTQGNVSLHVPGVYVVRYIASDSSGNKREKKRTITISGDICTPLQIKSSVASGTYTNKNVTLTVVGANGKAPSTSYHYQWQKLVNGTWTNIAGATSASYTETSESATQYRLVYNGLECSAQTNEYQMKIDKTAPACPSITSNVSASTWSNASLKITVNPTSDHASYDYAVSTDGGVYGTATTKKDASTFIVNGEGKKKAKVVVRDKAGNEKTCYSSEYWMDHVAPECPSITSNVSASTWSKADLKITVTPTSDHASYDYAISTDGGAYGTNTRATTTSEFAVSGDGKKKARVIVRDAAGNEKTCYSSEYWMDHTAPSGLTLTKSASGCVTSPATITVYLSATETGSGINRWAYSFDNVNYTNYASSNKSPFTTTPFSAVRNQTAYFRVYDNVGNYATTSTNICIVNPAPPAHTHAVGYLGTNVHAVSGATLQCGEYHTTAAYGYCGVCWDHGLIVRADTYWYCQNSPLYPRVVPD